MSRRIFNPRNFRGGLVKLFTRPLWILALISIVGCVSENSIPVVVLPPVVLNTLSVLTYDLTNSTLNLKGKFNLPGTSALNLVHIYSEAACATTPLANGVESGFESAGIQVSVSSTLPTSLYASTNTSTDCYFLIKYEPSHVAPASPTFTSTSPASPSRTSTTPAVFGVVSPVTLTVNLYDDSGCTHLVGTGPALNFSTAGIQATLSANQTNTLYVQGVEPFGNASTCALLTTYTHSTAGPTPPLFTALSPTSPSSTTLTPLITGQVSGSTTQVSIFSDPACGTKLAEGTTAEFTTTGIQIPVASNAATLLYGIAYDVLNQPSTCNYLSTFTHDTVAPASPTFSATVPLSPTRTTIYPLVKGAASADTAIVKLYSGVACTLRIGTGTKVEFESTGITASARGNDTTEIYARAEDAAGNASTCVHLVSFTNDTIPPDAPVLISTLPVSPTNQSVTPLIFGNAPSDSVLVSFFSEGTCTTGIGSGTPDDFLAVGIQITTPAPAGVGVVSTPIYAKTFDAVGNPSDCTFMLDYDYSNMPATAPTFVQTTPISPSRFSTTPLVLGWAAPTIVRVDLFNDTSCSVQIATGSKSAFTITGIPITVQSRFTTGIYAQTFDIYTNTSACTLLTSYMHEDRAPPSPTFGSTVPVSPNNQSGTPNIIGSAPSNPASQLTVSGISIYNSPSCTTRLGTGTAAVFATTGIAVTVPQDTSTPLYGRSTDAANNISPCTYLMDYIYSTLKPGKPIFGSASPATPSYNRNTTVIGTYAASADFLPKTSVGIYSDIACAVPLATAAPSAFTTTGIPITVAQNSITALYGKTIDSIGNESVCNFLQNYRHDDIGPANLTTTLYPNGSVGLSWTPDMVASPSPVYTLKRSLKSGGPYTIIVPQNAGASYTDISVSKNTTYYYVVSASNITGFSNNSAEASATVSVVTGANPTTLVATPTSGEIALTWTGFATSLFYKVYRSTTPGGPYTQIKTNLYSQNYTDTTVTNGVPYYYVVTATNPAGESIQSNEASAAAQALPSPPTNLSIVPMSSTPLCGGGSGVQLSWSAPSHYSLFTVNRGTQSTLTSPLTTTASTSYVDCAPYTGGSGQFLNSNYYTISANWGTLPAARSNEVAFGCNAGPMVTVSAGVTSIEISWGIMPSALSYSVKRSLLPGGPYTVLDAAFSGTLYSDSAVSAGQAYYYVVAANYSGNWQGYPSIEKSGILGPNPSPPTNLVLNLVGKLPQLTWTPPTNFNSFNVYKGPSASGPWSFLMSSATNTMIDAAFSTGLNYYYVTALWGTYETAGATSVAFRSGYPATITATPTSTQVNLSWASVAGASSYKVLRSLSSLGPYSTVLAAANATTTYADTSAVLNTGYFYVVSANFADGTSGPLSNEVSAMPGTGKIPSGLTVLDTTISSVSLAWSKVAGATSYKVYRYKNSTSGPWTLDGAAVAQANKNVTGLSSASAYQFRVTSMSPTESGTSAIVSATTYSAPGIPLITPENGQLTLQWGPTAGAITYNVLRSTDGTNFSTIVSGVPSSNYVDASVTNGILYFYQILATFPAGKTMTSAISAGSTPGMVPLTPGGITISQNSTGTDLVLSWPAVSGVTSYNIYLATTSGGPYGAAALSTTSSTGNGLSGLTPGTTYYIVVSSLNGTMESAYSTEISAIPLLSPPAPTIVTGPGAAIHLTWPAVVGASTYEVQRSTDLVNFTSLVTGSGAVLYNDAAVSAGNSYSYRYIPTGAAGVKMAPSLVSAATTPVVSPLTPLALRAHAPNLTSVILDWITVPNTLSYNIYRGSATGGPYSLLSSAVDPVHTYSDSSVVSGNSYYYVITSVNIYGVESVFSNEAGIFLSSTPAGLVATLGANAVNLSWTAVPGAVSYIAKRSTQTGGPYGTLATGIIGPAYIDANAQNGQNYYYVVEAVFAGGRISPDSAEASVMGNEALNLQVPIELTDQGLSSALSTLAFESTQTSMDAADYDGTVTFEFEATVTNTDSVNRDVTLIDAASTILGTITVPASTTNPRRMRSVFTPAAGKKIYRVNLAGTTTAGELQVLSSRILVTQVGASRTRIYIPLLASSIAPTSADVAAPIETSQLSTYGNLLSASLYRRDPSAYSDLEDFNPWELEAVVATGGGATGTVALYNTTQASMVTDTETEFSDAVPTLVNAPFDEGVSGFSTVNDLEKFSVAITCKNSCSGALKTSLYKAGLWVKLTHLTKAEIPFRLSMGAASAGATLDTERTLMNLSLFSNPVPYFQSVITPPNGGSATMTLMSLGVLDSTLAGAAAVSSSALNYSTYSKTWNRSGALTLTTGDRFLPAVSAIGGTATISDSSLIIRATK